MLITLITLLLSLVGLGILICIHELGHLLAAKSVGMKIESFGIGFGKPIFHFKVKSVPVHVGWIPFGGYVRIAGMEEPGTKRHDDQKSGHHTHRGEHKEEHHHKEDPNGFFKKSPWERIWVACAGPLANILFCLMAFTLVWLGGGRNKPYSFMTDRVGVIQKGSALAAQGVQSGDRILSYDHVKVASSRDHLRAAMMSGKTVSIETETLRSQKKGHLQATSTLIPREKGLKTFGVMSPASFLVWNPPRSGLVNLNQTTPFKAGDRIIWVNGKEIYSIGQMRDVLRNDEVYLTLRRNGKVLHMSIPRCRVSDLKLAVDVKGELVDWLYEADMSKAKLASLSFIPYNLTHECVVEGSIPYVHDEGHAMAETLLPGDTILAAWGIPLSKSSQLLNILQQPRAAVIVERGVSYRKINSLEELDRMFVRPYLSDELTTLVQSIGLAKERGTEEPSGVHLQLLASVPLVEKSELLAPHLLSSEGEEPKEENMLYLGLVGVQDVTCLYNPSPIEAMKALFEEITSTLGALFSGTVSPKWMCGPVGIVQLVQQQWAYGGFDVLFWLGAISFNLALINLFPLPVLDGGYILMGLFEIVTFKRITPKMSARIITPFAFLLFALLIYLTYNDIVRIIHQIYR